MNHFPELPLPGAAAHAPLEFECPACARRLRTAPGISFCHHPCPACGAVIHLAVSIQATDCLPNIVEPVDQRDDSPSSEAVRKLRPRSWLASRFLFFHSNPSSRI